MHITLLRDLIFFTLSFIFLSQFSSSTPLNEFQECFQENSDKLMSNIITPQNSTFQSILLSRIHNKRYTTLQTPKPLAIIQPNHETQIKTIILCAKQHNLQLRIRSCGHDFESLSSVSTVPFIILDMLNFRSININYSDETAWVQAGASLGELYYKIGMTSPIHGFSAALCPGVCTGGHISGGGYGPMMRMHGLTIDNVLDARLMDVNGDVLDRKSMGEDVFWAIRGGGGASFGVIISWKIKLSRVPPKVTVFRVKRTEEQGSFEAFHRWQYVAPNVPKETFIRAELDVVNKTIMVYFIGHYLGQAQDLVSLLEQRYPELDLKKKECFEMSWVESTVFWIDGHPAEKITSLDELLEAQNGAVDFYKVKSDYIKKPFTKPALKRLWKMMIKIGHVSIKWNPYGGRMSEISEWETPFPHRAGNLALVQYYVYWNEDGIDVTNYYMNLSRQLYKKMAPYVSTNPRETFLNYRDLEIGENPNNQTFLKKAIIYGRKYFKGNFDRLVKAKTFIDPGNFFRNEQSIPPLQTTNSV